MSLLIKAFRLFCLWGYRFTREKAIKAWKEDGYSNFTMLFAWFLVPLVQTGNYLYYELITPHYLVPFAKVLLCDFSFIIIFALIFRHYMKRHKFIENMIEEAQSIDEEALRSEIRYVPLTIILPLILWICSPLLVNWFVYHIILGN